VLCHGRSVFPYCNLASGIGHSGCTMKSRGRKRALEEYLRTNPHFSTSRRALGMEG
jgi:hypothetical protein